MDFHTFVDATLLGILEGLTEFIPVSSTGHLILAAHFLGFESPDQVFEILIQFGAILALLVVYAERLWRILFNLPRDRQTQHFVIGVIIAFLPAAVIGALAHKFIEQVLLSSPMLICIMLILGGIVLLWVDRWAITPKYKDVTTYPYWLYLAIGFFQCLAMIPGTSRSGSTIVGALLLGADKRSAAEFSFFLAMPTMLGAFVFDFYSHRHDLGAANLSVIAVGFVFAFIAAVFVVRGLLDYVSKRGYAMFGWWRLVVGAVGLAALLIWG